MGRGDLLPLNIQGRIKGKDLLGDLEQECWAKQWIAAPM